ncbi:class III lanthipeptide [Streptomyces sp. CB01881]|nr:class III lanthipeptide [Streptomyces sp. CB01881]
MTEILALQQLELQTEEAEEASAFPCFSIYASSFIDTDTY